MPDFGLFAGAGPPHRRACSAAGTPAVTAGPVVPAIKALVAHVRGDVVWRAVEPTLDALEGGAERRPRTRYDALFSPAEAAS